MAGEKLVEKSVDADGFNIRYWEEGEGDPVVVLHGAGDPCRRCALDLLSAQNRILLFELPGWGEQPNDRSQSLADLANTVVAAMDALGLDRAHVMGRRSGARLPAPRARPSRAGHVDGARVAGRVRWGRSRHRASRPSR